MSVRRPQAAHNNVWASAEALRPTVSKRNESGVAVPFISSTPPRDYATTIGEMENIPKMRKAAMPSRQAAHSRGDVASSRMLVSLERGVYSPGGCGVVGSRT